jgi:hypothetical protein
MKDASYDRRVYWYNNVIEEARLVALETGNAYYPSMINPKRKDAIKKVLTKAIVDLERTLNYQYDIDRDPETEKRIDEISEQMANSPNPGVFKRKGRGEARRSAIKSTIGVFDDETPSDFFDRRHQEIIQRQEELGIPYMTSPYKPYSTISDDKKGPITSQEKRKAEKEVLANLKELAKEEDPKIIDVSYKGRVDWYNKVIEEARQTSLKPANAAFGSGNLSRVSAIEDVLTKHIVDLEKMADPKYDISKDPTTQKRIAEISKQMADSDDLNDFKRKRKSETRSNIMKFFNGVKNFITGETESPADFFDNRHQDVVSRLRERKNLEAIELRKNQPKLEHRKLQEEYARENERQRTAAGQYAQLKIDLAKKERQKYVQITEQQIEEEMPALRAQSEELKIKLESKVELDSESKKQIKELNERSKKLKETVKSLKPEIDRSAEIKELRKQINALTPPPSSVGGFAPDQAPNNGTKKNLSRDRSSSSDHDWGRWQ